MERYRWLIEALFAGGVYPSLECYAHSNNDLVYRGRVVSKLDGHGGAELELKRVGGVFPGVLPLLRERGLAALDVTRPPPRARLRHVLHLTRDDAGHRALNDDAALERAFLGAGYATFERCCDWNAPDAARTAVRRISHADVVVGMHGAAMTHLIFAKDGAVAVELFSAQLVAERSFEKLWFFARFTSHYGNYASSLGGLKRFEEARSLLRRTLPVARRVLGDSHDITLSMRLHYAAALCKDPAATLGDLREAVATLEVMERTARQVFGGSHPLVRDIENHLRYALAALRARATGNA